MKIKPIYYEDTQKIMPLYIYGIKDGIEGLMFDGVMNFKFTIPQIVKTSKQNNIEITKILQMGDSSMGYRVFEVDF